MTDPASAPPPGGLLPTNSYQPQRTTNMRTAEPLYKCPKCRDCGWVYPTLEATEVIRCTCNDPTWRPETTSQFRG